MRTTSPVLLIFTLLILFISATTLASSPSSIKYTSTIGQGTPSTNAIAPQRQRQSQTYQRRYYRQHESLTLFRRDLLPPRTCPPDMGLCIDMINCCADGYTCCPAGKCCPPDHYCITRPSGGCCPNETICHDEGEVPPNV